MIAGDDHYTMPKNRTYCGRFRCCREENHAGDCEIDITYLEDDELDSIRKSGEKHLPTRNDKDAA